MFIVDSHKHKHNINTGIKQFLLCLNILLLQFKDSIFLKGLLQENQFKFNSNYKSFIIISMTQNMGFKAQQVKQIRFYVSTGAALFTAVALFQTLKFQLRIFDNRSKSKLVNSGIVHSPDQIKQFPLGKQLLIKGTIDTLNKQSLKSVSRALKNQSLALRLIYKQNIFSNQSYDLTKKDFNINLRQVMKGSDFNMCKNITLNENKSGVILKNLDKIDFSTALDIIRWDTKKRDLTMFQNLTAFCLMLLRGAVTVAVKDPNVTFLRGIDVGTREVQAGIKIGASLTILGSIGITTEGILFVEPSAIFKERFSFLHQLNEQYAELISKRNVWLAAFVIGAIYVGRRTYNYVKKNNIKMPWQKSDEITHKVYDSKF